MADKQEQEDITGLEPRQEEEKEKQILLRRLPQGPGSKLDADTVRGLVASRKNSPNSLFALDENGKFSTDVGGGVTGTFISGDSTPKTITVTNGIITAIV